MNKENIKVVPLVYDTYLKLIENAVGTNMFRTMYASVDDSRQDVMRDGDLSCAFFVSSILKVFDYVEKVHATVNNTVKDLEKSGWQKSSDLKKGAVLVWEEKIDGSGEKHKPIGFYIGDNMAISNNSQERIPQKHHYTYGEINNLPVRKIANIFWKKDLESNQIKNVTPTYFQGNYSHPQHISVGGILLNEKKEICCHHFYTKDLKGYWNEEGLDDFYILMRETLEPNETLEHALHRGLQEEFGATAKLVDYVGSIKSSFKHKEVAIEKTTLYFSCELISQDLSRRTANDIEKNSLVEWRQVDYLIPIMKEQAIKFKRTDVDESSILERLKIGRL